MLFAKWHGSACVELPQNSPGETVKPGSVMIVKNEGMPKHKHPFVHGQLNQTVSDKIVSGTCYMRPVGSVW